MFDIRCHRRNQCRGCRARTNDENSLVLVVEILGPRLRVNDESLVRLHVGPLRRVPMRMLVVALTHPDKVGGHFEDFIGVEISHAHGPQIGLARPLGALDTMAVVNVLFQIVLIQDFTEISTNLIGGGNGAAGPRLEAIPEGVEIAVGTNTGISVHVPGAAEALVRFVDCECRSRPLRLQVIRRTDSGNSCADDQDINMLCSHVFTLCAVWPRTEGGLSCGYGTQTTCADPSRLRRSGR